MPVTTKRGDRGTTGIFTGERVVKVSPIIEANGTIDELGSFIGEAKHHVDDELREILETIQRHLYSLMAEIASKGEYKQVGEEEVRWLEELTARFEGEVKLEGFVLPGSTVASAKLDVCRTVARRAERRVARLLLEYGFGEGVLVYLNRLSDALFMMARYIEWREGKITYAK